MSVYKVEWNEFQPDGEKNDYGRLPSHSRHAIVVSYDAGSAITLWESAHVTPEGWEAESEIRISPYTHPVILNDDMPRGLQE